MLTQERINEIALECAGLNDACIDPEHLTVHRIDVVDMFNLFLSRIREEQEPYAYMSITGQCAKHLSVFEVGNDNGPFAKLFTIPPSSPDCKKLVEALKRIAYDSIPRGEDPESYISRLAINALANHAKRMKGGE